MYLVSKETINLAMEIALKNEMHRYKRFLQCLVCFCLLIVFWPTATILQTVNIVLSFTQPKISFQLFNIENYTLRQFTNHSNCNLEF